MRIVSLYIATKECYMFLEPATSLKKGDVFFLINKLFSSWYVQGTLNFQHTQQIMYIIFKMGFHLL